VSGTESIVGAQDSITNGMKYHRPGDTLVDDIGELSVSSVDRKVAQNENQFIRTSFAFENLHELPQFRIESIAKMRFRAFGNSRFGYSEETYEVRNALVEELGMYHVLTGDEPG
jgi:hypothetical protein